MNTVLWIALVQGAMGAFDTVYYHEWTLRLPSQANAKRELRLHATRDFAYALLFFSLGWVEWHGGWAWAFAGIVAAEIVITLWDFLEEDRTRKLPGGERVMHALMGIVYGTMLAFFAPIWWEWLHEPTGFVRVTHGWQGWAMGAMAGGVFLSGVRDLVASRGIES